MSLWRGTNINSRLQYKSRKDYTHGTLTVFASFHCNFLVSNFKFLTLNDKQCWWTLKQPQCGMVSNCCTDHLCVVVGRVRHDGEMRWNYSPKLWINWGNGCFIFTGRVSIQSPNNNTFISRTIENSWIMALKYCVVPLWWENYRTSCTWGCHNGKKKYFIHAQYHMCL